MLLVGRSFISIKKLVLLVFLHPESPVRAAEILVRGHTGKSPAESKSASPPACCFPADRRRGRPASVAAASVLLHNVGA